MENGNVKIPYPFGTTEGCYLNDTANIYDGYYFINCTTNARGQPQPMIRNFNVTSISTKLGEIGLQMYIFIDCYDQSGTPLSPNMATLSVPIFTVSVTKNKFVAVGYDTYALLRGFRNGQALLIGCQSTYNNTLRAVSGACSGIGCCQVDIPPDFTDVEFKVFSYKNHVITH